MITTEHDGQRAGPQLSLSLSRCLLEVALVVIGLAMVSTTTPRLRGSGEVASKWTLNTICLAERRRGLSGGERNRQGKSVRGEVFGK